MFPRYRWGFLVWILICLSVFFHAGSSTVLASESHAPLLEFYQKHISAIDGNRCPMNPSCSEYARQAMKKHGPILGWIMTCDRLMRCGRSEKKIAPLVQIKVQTKEGYQYSDPLENNDFWWFPSHGTFGHETSK